MTAHERNNNEPSSRYTAGGGGMIHTGGMNDNYNQRQEAMPLGKIIFVLIQCSIQIDG